MAMRIVPRLLPSSPCPLPMLAAAASTAATATRAIITGRTVQAAVSKARRGFQTSARRPDADAGGGGVPSTTPLPARRPVGALRGGLFGFFFGTTLAGGAVYYYAAQENKVANEMLTQDIYALEAAIERMSKYTTVLEGRMEALERKKRS